MGTTFTISQQSRLSYAGLYILKYMHEHKMANTLELTNDSSVLEPIINWLIKTDHLKPTSNHYSISQKGLDVLTKFKDRFQNFLTKYDVYCCVDLEAGEFAFSHYHEYEDSDEWQEFLTDERWDDLRVAVAQYEGIDPIEMIFMSYLSEDRFGRDEEGFKYDLLLGNIWDEIWEIAHSAIQLKSLGYVDQDQIISSENVITDIITKGREVLAQLR